MEAVKMLTVHNKGFIFMAGDWELIPYYHSLLSGHLARISCLKHLWMILIPPLVRRGINKELGYLPALHFIMNISSTFHNCLQSSISSYGTPGGNDIAWGGGWQRERSFSWILPDDSLS